MDLPAVITATAVLVTAIGGVIATILTRRSVARVDTKLDTVHELVNSKSERDAEYLVQLIDLLKARDIDVPVNRGALGGNPASVPDHAP